MISTNTLPKLAEATLRPHKPLTTSQKECQPKSGPFDGEPGAPIKPGRKVNGKSLTDSALTQFRINPPKPKKGKKG